MRVNDSLNAKLRDFPMVQLDKNYTFTGPSGPVKLSDLFESRKQLIVYHFMLGPEDEAGCPGCSFMADNLPSHTEHLNLKDTTLVLVSRAPYNKIKAFKERMGWPFKWYSSAGQTFNYDFQVTNDENVAPVVYNVRFSTLFLRNCFRVFSSELTMSRSSTRRRTKWPTTSIK
jgi:predicted dithiol-disulfide oxidoreductase (DUF899 family)